jgi:hypothetical protein
MSTAPQGHIYYCMGGKPSAGGQHVNVEHVVALRAAGWRASLLYMETGQPVQTFETAAPVVRSSQLTLTSEHDVYVIPEPWKQVIEFFAQRPGTRIIHCQNPFYVFHGFKDIQSIRAMGYRQMLSCSGYTTSQLRQFGYEDPIHTVRPAVDPVFTHRNQPRQLQIAYMPRKREIETVFVQGLFRSLYPEWKEVPWVPIKDMTRAQCAEVLNASAVFASFSFIEGLGLPPLEAMACGCIVAGFDGLGGADYANPSNGFWAKEGDHASFAQQLALALRASQNPAWRHDLMQAQKSTLSHYNMSSFRQSTHEAWSLIVKDRPQQFRLP